MTRTARREVIVVVSRWSSIELELEVVWRGSAAAARSGVLTRHARMSVSLDILAAEERAIGDCLVELVSEHC